MNVGKNAYSSGLGIDGNRRIGPRFSITDSDFKLCARLPFRPPAAFRHQPDQAEMIANALDCFDARRSKFLFILLAASFIVLGLFMFGHAPGSLAIADQVEIA